MSTQRDKLKELFEKLNKLNPTKYEALLKSLCDELNISYKDNEDLEKLLKKLLDKVCISTSSEKYDKVLRDVRMQIVLIDVLDNFNFDNLDNKKNNDQGLTL